MFSRLLLRVLDTAYGLVATPLALSAFALLCISVICGPTLAIRRAIGRAGVRLCLLIIGVPMRVRGLEKIPDGACIAVSNHASYVDGLVLTSALPSRFTFVVQDGAASWPLVGLTIRRMGVSFVNRRSARAGAAQTKALIRRLKAGQALAIFAEGTFDAEPGLLAFKTGAFMIATRADAKVVPVAIRGTRRLFGGGWWLMRWNPIEVEILDPIQPPVTHERIDIHQLRDATRAQILQHCGEPDRAPHSRKQHDEEHSEEA